MFEVQFFVFDLFSFAKIGNLPKISTPKVIIWEDKQKAKQK